MVILNTVLLFLWFCWDLTHLGEMLGAHGMRNKFNFLEEAVRVPMIMSFPGRMPANAVVKKVRSRNL